MRKPLLLFLLILLSLILGATYLVSTLIALLFESGLQNAILPEDVASRMSWAEDRQHHPIPKIIHQTWKNETVPEAWSIAQYSCRDLHPDYKYIVLSLTSPFPFCPFSRVLVLCVGEADLWVVVDGCEQ